MRAVVDTSPLVFLCKLDEMDLLPHPCGTTSTVLDELRAGPTEGRPEVIHVEHLIKSGGIKISDPGQGRLPVPARLGPGEESVLRLALEKGVEEVVVDDKFAIRAAKTLDLRPVSTAFLLLRARRSGRWTFNQYKGRLERLVGHGYFLSAPLYERLLSAGEKGVPME